MALSQQNAYNITSLSSIIRGNDKGDILAYDGSKWDILPKSIDGYVLELDSSTSNGVSWKFRPTSLGNVYVHADIAAQTAQTGMKEGDISVVTSDATGDKSTFIYKTSSGWIQISNYNMDALADVIISTPATDNILIYNGSAWVNRSGLTSTQWAILQQLNQFIDTSANFQGSSFTASGPVTVGGATGITTEGAFYIDTADSRVKFYNQAVTTDLLQVGLDRHTHANKANLDTINQNLATTSGPTFLGVTAGAINTDRIYFATPSTGIGIQNIWYESTGSKFAANDSRGSHYIALENTAAAFTSVTASGPVVVGGATGITTEGAFYLDAGDSRVKFYNQTVTVDLLQVGLDRHTHSNKANLDTINQNLSTTSGATFLSLTANDINITRIYFATPTTGIGIQNIWYESTLNKFAANDSRGSHYIPLENTEATFTKLNIDNSGSASHTILKFASHPSYSGLIQMGANGLIFTESTGASIKGCLLSNGDASFYKLRLDSGGVGSTATHVLQVVGDQSSTSASTFIVISDQRIKSQIVDIPDTVMDDFLNIRFVEYKHKYDLSKTKRGIIADEVASIHRYSCCIDSIPEFKYIDDATKEEVKVPDCKNFLNDNMMFDAFKCIQVLIKQNKDLTNRIIALETELGI